MKRNLPMAAAAAAIFLPVSQVAADLTTDLVAYYDFEQSDAIGLLNKAPGATGFDLSWGSTGTLSQTGFSGNAAFTVADGTSDRGTLLAGNALNIVDLEGAYVVSPIASTDLGDTFTISIWTYLAYGDSNGSNRFHALESANGTYDVSWGTTGNVSSTGYDDFLAYVDTTATSPISGLAAFAWQHAILEYDLSGADPTVSVYVNGSTTPITATDTSATFTFAGLNIGRERIDGSGDRDWDGMIDEVAIWDRALTEAERTEVYNLGAAGSPVASAGVVVSVTSADPLEGTVSGGGLYDSGTEVPIGAVAEPGYVFVEWTGDFAGQPASFTYTANADSTATAVFGEDTSDPDGDNLTTYEEVVLIGTLPDNPDTDGDDIPDGDEWDVTYTDPLTDDSALVDFVRANLCEATAGAVAMGRPQIDVDPGTGEVTLTLGFSGSADGTAFAPLVPTSIAPVVDGWEVTLPAPSSSVDSYILLGEQP